MLGAHVCHFPCACVNADMHTHTYAQSHFYVGHIAIGGGSLAEGQRGDGDDGVGALIHTCLPKDATAMQRERLPRQSCGNTNRPWKVGSLSVSANVFLSDFCATLFEWKHQSRQDFLGQFV